MGYLHYSPSLGTMARCTTPDKCPFSHWDTEAMKRMAPITLSGKPEIIQKAYVGLFVKPESIAPALNQLRTAMDPDLFDLVTRNKAKRDNGDNYHMTLVGWREYKKLKADGKNIDVLDKGFHFNLIGVGTVSNSTTQTWYAIAQSVAIDNWRNELGLPRHDLHITLGFTSADIHGVPKNHTTLV